MNEMLQRISSYNLFNYLFPGATFAYLVERMTNFSLLQDNIITALFLYYFIGLVISRIGSLILEPALRKVIPHSSYEDFLSASSKDEKIDILSEQNNVYRTMLSMFLTLFIVLIYNKILSMFPPISKCGNYFLLVLLTVMFFYAYRKQASYIVQRIKLGKEESG